MSDHAGRMEGRVSGIRLAVPAEKWERIFGKPVLRESPSLSTMDADRRSYYGIPEDMTACLCDQGSECLSFELGYPWCLGCGEHHRMPVARAIPDPCPVDVWAEQWEREEVESTTPHPEKGLLAWVRANVVATSAPLDEDTVMQAWERVLASHTEPPTGHAQTTTPHVG